MLEKTKKIVKLKLVWKTNKSNNFQEKTKTANHGSLFDFACVDLNNNV